MTVILRKQFVSELDPLNLLGLAYGKAKLVEVNYAQMHQRAQTVTLLVRNIWPDAGRTE